MLAVTLIFSLGTRGVLHLIRNFFLDCMHRFVHKNLSSWEWGEADAATAISSFPTGYIRLNL